MWENVERAETIVFFRKSPPRIGGNAEKGMHPAPKLRVLARNIFIFIHFICYPFCCKNGPGFIKIEAIIIFACIIKTFTHKKHTTP